MNRRLFVAGLGSAAAWPAVARGQQRTLTIGVLAGTSASVFEPMSVAFLRSLQELGWTQGQNIRVDIRFWKGGQGEAGATARELLAVRPDVVVAIANLALDALKPIAGDVPIVFAGVGDAVGGGYVASIIRPGGNITGFESYVPTMGGKWLGVLKDTVPSITRALVLVHPETPAHQGFWRSIEGSSSLLGIDASAAGVHNATEIHTAMSSFAQKPHGGVVNLASAVTNTLGGVIVDLELRYRLPAVHSVAGDGALVSYGLDWPYEMRRTAEYVDRILRGTRPAELPVQSPTKFKLAINLKTAKSIGVEISPSMLLRADEVIE
jgi:putative tryptophan/tyrosine transport system substrate-binding protein